MISSLSSIRFYWWGNHAALSHGAYCHSVLKGKVFRPSAVIIISFALSPWPAMQCRCAHRHYISGAPPPAKGRRYVLRFTSHASRPLATHPAKEEDYYKQKSARHPKW